MRNWDSLFGSSKGTELMDKSMTEVINNRLWKPQSVGDISDEPGQSGVDHSRMELLQMTTMLVKYHHNLIQETRKDIIKFGWNFIKLEDVINKLAAYVLIAYFIAQYDTPAKIAVQ
ncbi:transcription-associated protein 1, partial [Cryomyces antarcticus]